MKIKRIVQGVYELENGDKIPAEQYRGYIKKLGKKEVEESNICPVYPVAEKKKRKWSRKKK